MDIRKLEHKVRDRNYLKYYRYKYCVSSGDYIINRLQNAVYLLYSISKEYNLEIATKKDEGIWFRWSRPLKNENYYKQ